VLWLDAESGLGIEDFPDWTTAKTWLTVHQANVEFPAVVRMGMTVVITELQFGESLIHVGTLEVEDAVSRAVLAMRQIWMHASPHGMIKNDAFWTSLFIGDAFQTVIEFGTANIRWERVESIASLAVRIRGLGRLQFGPFCAVNVVGIVAHPNCFRKDEAVVAHPLRELPILEAVVVKVTLGAVGNPVGHIPRRTFLRGIGKCTG